MTQNKENLLDIAYDLCLKEFKDKQFTTSQIWKLLSKKIKLDANGEKNEYIDFYVALLQEPRFVAISNDNWKLRDYVTRDEFDKIFNSKYSNVELTTTIDDKDDEKLVNELIDEDEEETLENVQEVVDAEDDMEYDAEVDEDVEIDEEETEEEEDDE